MNELPPVAAPVNLRARLLFAYLWATSIIVLTLLLYLSPVPVDPYLASVLQLIAAVMIGLLGMFLIYAIVRPARAAALPADRAAAAPQRRELHTAAAEEVARDTASAQSFHANLARVRALDAEAPGELPPAFTEPLLQQLERYSIAALFARQPALFIEEDKVLAAVLERALTLTHAAGAALLLRVALVGQKDMAHFTVARLGGRVPPCDEGFAAALDREAVARLQDAAPAFAATPATAPQYAALLPDPAMRRRLLLPLVFDQDLAGFLHLVLPDTVEPPAGQDEQLLLALAREAAAALAFTRAYAELRGNYLAGAKKLAQIWEHWHPYARGHAAGVARYARVLAEELKLPPAQCEAIECAAYLHDIGELGVSDLILHKPGPLSDEERLLVQRHPLLSMEIVGAMEMKREIAEIVMNHQERWDGAGYPEGLKGEAIPLGARILTLADAFSAMTADRPHRAARPVLEVLEEFGRLAGQQFDPGLVKPFTKMMEKIGMEDFWVGRPG